MKALLLIIDSFGIGALPDAAIYGDEGANTALRICETVVAEPGGRGVQWPTLQKLGLGNCAALLGHQLPGCAAAKNPGASFGVMAELSGGKDTTTGHWELAGLQLKQPFRTFPLEYPSFPEELVSRFEEQSGYKVLGNRGASGTVIIEDLGPAHLAGDGLIVYTSADSVLQIAAHEEIVPIEELYRVCELARELCDPYRVGRVIARPFKGQPGSFVRTNARRDFSMLPPEKTILNHLSETGVETVAIGKIGDIFAEQGIDKSYHDSGNAACLDRVVRCLLEPGPAESDEKDIFLFINLVDTDMFYGHRRDIQGYHDAVARIDERLEEIISLMSGEDILLISADHGCDPGFKGTDHTREYVPLLYYSKKKAGEDLGIRSSFCDVAQSLASYFSIPAITHGETFI